MYAPDFGRRGIFIVLGLCAAVAVLILYPRLSPAASVDSIARAMVEKCSQNAGDRSACYESEIPALYPGLDIARIFDVIRAVRDEDGTYQFCHVAAHKVGERVVAEDPDKWVDAVPLNPADGLCSNGFIHGVVSGRFRAEVLDDDTTQALLPDLRRACEPHGDWHPSPLDRAMCYHGMGHLFDFITDADLDKALSLCATTAGEYIRVCVQGVFMQIYQPLEPDDFALIERMEVRPTADTVPQFCARFASDPIAQGSCIEESWPLMQDEIFDGSGVERLCSWEPNEEEQKVCYIAMSSIIGRTSLSDPSQAARTCGVLPERWQATCFGYSAEAVLEEDRNDAVRSIALCDLAESGTRQKCIELLIDHASFIFGPNTATQERFCAALPNEYKGSCSAAEAH